MYKAILNQEIGCNRRNVAKLVRHTISIKLYLLIHVQVNYIKAKFVMGHLENSEA